MTLSISLPKSSPADAVLCYYTNATPHLQVVKIQNEQVHCFERVVFPNQRLMFEAPPTAVLDVFSGSRPNALLADRIPCDRLQVVEHVYA